MKPTVGRIVHFHPNERDQLHKNNSADFHAALVTQVWPDDNVNLQVFPAWGVPELRGSVPPEPGVTGNSYWAWPPREI